MAEKYITQRANGRWMLRLPASATEGRRQTWQFDTEEDAIVARDAALNRLTDEPEVDGLGPDYELMSDEDLWVSAFAAQKLISDRNRRRKDQHISIKGTEPFAIGYLSDFHIGGDIDYGALRRDVECICETRRLYAEFHGDGIDNWIMGKLAGLQRGQALAFDAEVQLFAAVLDKLAGKLLWVVAGNHENWTRKLAGVDRVREALKGTRVLYDPYEVVFTLHYGDTQMVVKARHKWKYGSVFNPTHGIEVGWQRGSQAFDIGLGGHTHIGTLCRTFIRHEQMVWAVLTGTYKTNGEYGRELGLPLPHGTGSGAHVFFPGEPPIFCQTVQQAAWILKAAGVE